MYPLFARIVADQLAVAQTQPGQPINHIVGDPADQGKCWTFSWGVNGEPFLDTQPIYVEKETLTATIGPPEGVPKLDLPGMA